MPNLVETFLRNARAERMRQLKVKIPQGRPRIPKGLELKYAVQLRNYQRAINQEFLEVLKPIIATYRQDASTAEIETAVDKTQDVVNAAILEGAVLAGIVTTQGQDITKWNDQKYNKPIYNIAGFNNVPNEQTNEMLNSWTQENIKLVKGINDDQTKKIETLLLRADREDLQAGGLTKEIRKIMNSSLKRATLIARDQTLKLNGQIDRVKQTGAGVEEYIWRSSRDERVRPEHRAREGKKFRWDSPPPGGHPGQAIQCR
jgi:SPP1 gp7 family putative phage head morphogenesis protein